MNTDTGGTGGGVSDYLALPAYQQGFPIPPNLNDHTVRRGVPDVAADSDPGTGYNVVVHGEIHQLGGTSAVAPLWAGLTALMNEALPTRVGFFLPQVYANQEPFREILDGNNVPPPPSPMIGYVARPTWNACTGLGVPNGSALMLLLAKLAQPNSRVAAAVWDLAPFQGGMFRLRVYYQGLNNSILENAWNLSEWSPGATLQGGAPGTAIASVAWGPLSNVRVYFLDNRNEILEYCWNGNDWTTGHTLSGAAGSALAVVAWGGGKQIRLFYQDANNLIREYRWTDGGWFQGPQFPAALPGTGLAAVAWGEKQIRLYCQMPDLSIREYCWFDDGRPWILGATLQASQARSALAAVAWDNGNQIRLYAQNSSNWIREYRWMDNQWTLGAKLSQAIPRSPLASIGWTAVGGQTQLRVYDEANNALNEWVYGDNGWVPGAMYIPVASSTGEQVKTERQRPGKDPLVAGSGRARRSVLSLP